MFLSKDAVLACFACGKTTGLVADIGAETTTVSPVVEGWLEAKGACIKRSRCVPVCVCLPFFKKKSPTSESLFSPRSNQINPPRLGQVAAGRARNGPLHAQPPGQERHHRAALPARAQGDSGIRRRRRSTGGTYSYLLCVQ